jgi:hypothetical protein
MFLFINLASYVHNVIRTTLLIFVVKYDLVGTWWSVIFAFQLVLFTSVKPVPTVEKEVLLLYIQPDFDYNYPSGK